MARFGMFLGCLLAVGCGDSLETISAGADAGDDAAETSTGGSGGGTGGLGGAAGTGGSGATGGATGGTAGAAGTGGATGGTGGTAGTGGATGGTGGGCACDALEQCFGGSLCVSRAVTVPAGFAIDATEVTRDQYQAWLASQPATSGQDSNCDWNDSFTADTTCMAKESVCQGAGCGKHPQVCIDMCDATAYCRAIGKHVCGANGGGTVLGTDDNDPSKSDWFHACTSGGLHDFVYGDGPDSSKCNDYMELTTTTVPVASMPGCQSPEAAYAGIYDLIGNVWEWEDNCTVVPGEMDICHPRGFSFGMGAAMPMCEGSNYARRNEAADTVGFRCCCTDAACGLGE